MVDQNCAYCVEGDLVAKFGIKICELETSKVYLFKEQSHPGRCIVAHKKHVGDMNELTAEESNFSEGLSSKTMLNGFFFIALALKSERKLSIKLNLIAYRLI